MAARGEPQHRVLGEQPLGRREPAEAQALVGVVERELELAAAARFAAALRIGREPQPHLPQQLAPREPEAVAPAHPHQVLDRSPLEPGRRAAYEVTDTPIGTVSIALLHDFARRILTPIPYRSEEHTSELQSHSDLVCRLLLEKKNDLHTPVSANEDSEP